MASVGKRLASSWQAIVWGVEMQRDDDAGSGDPIAPPSSRYASDQKDTVSRQRNSQINLSIRTISSAFRDQKDTVSRQRNSQINLSVNTVSSAI